MNAVAAKYNKSVDDVTALFHLLVMDLVYSGAPEGEGASLTNDEREYIYYAAFPRRFIKCKQSDSERKKNYLSGWIPRQRMNGSNYKNGRVTRTRDVLGISEEEAISLLSDFWDAVLVKSEYSMTPDNGAEYYISMDKFVIKAGIEEMEVNIELEKSLEYLSKIEYTSEVAVIKEECISKLIYKNYNEGHYITALNYINQIEEKEQFKEIEIDCLWNRANNEYDEGNYLQTITYLDKIGDLTELEDNGVLADELLQKSLQAYGMDLFNSGDFNSAVKYLKRLDPKDDMINETIDIAMFMDKLQGVWYSDGSRSGHEYNGWTETQILYASNGAVMFTNDWEMNKIYEQIYVKGTRLYLESQAPGLEYEIRMYFQDDDLVRVESGDKEFNEADKLFTYEKVESFPEPAKKPSIGMTAQEVLDSTWGKPEKINKSTYTWGVTEQWCYSGYRYIYLEDGIVTSISE